jgi:hypothetical protein
MNCLNLTGERYGILTVESQAPHHRGKTAWRCRCDCGRVLIAPTGKLRSGRRKSCGCVEKKGGHPVVHGHCPKSGPSREWVAWSAMVMRCHNPKAANYAGYGGRGIVVCDRWRVSFDNFLADVPPHPGKGYSLDRKDVNGNYEPNNVRWATAYEQSMNRRNNKLEPHEQAQVTWLVEIGQSHDDIARFFGISRRYVRKLSPSKEGT